ncbi:MAG: gliding motility protein GldN, partial [Bacteroidia bacterium]
QNYIADPIEYEDYEYAESEKEENLDYFTYQRISTNNRAAIQYPKMREADVVFARRIEQVMQVKEKQNALCQWAKNPLSKVIFDAAARGQLTAYKNDSFSSSYRADKVYSMFSEKEIFQVPDRDFPGEFIDTVVYSDYKLEDVVKWKIIEDWIFDKQSGQQVVRIVGIAPIMNLKSDGVKIAEYEGFYIKWGEARKLLVNEPAFNRHNEAGSFTYYDFFEQRLFSSYITKEPNMQDLDFADYDEFSNNPLAQMLEAKRVKNELMNMESDWWQD